MKRLTLLGLTMISHFIHVNADDRYLDYNVDCGPHIDVVSTDTSFAYIPYYVKLHRCQGKDIFVDPHGRNCVPKNQTAITYKVELFQTGEFRTIKLFNHTDCEYVCEEDISSCAEGQGWHEDTCSCCEKDEVCAGNYIWDRSQCRCVCPTKGECIGEEVWDRFQCRCVCPTTSKDRCGNPEPYPTIPTSLTTGNNPNASKVIGEPQCVKYQLVILIAVVEFVLVIVLCILVFYFGFYRQNEGRYNVSMRVNKRKKSRKRSQNSVIRNKDVGKSGENLNNSENNNVTVIYDRRNLSSSGDNDVATIYDIDTPDKPVFVIKNGTS